ncbi:MAG: hypothetical protein HQK52_02135 [Oligoflexia bacterium]|nr:hypothetical protein [Oligoflexia bacterium]
MKKQLKSLLLVSMLSLVSCFGGGSGSVGGGGGGGGGGSYSSNADKFVSALNAYYGTSYGDKIRLVKEHGQEAYEYCVIYDDRSNQYVAYNLSGYYPGMSIGSYLSSAGNRDIIGNLEYTSYGTYYSWAYDIHFEETAASAKDLEKVGAFIQEKKNVAMGEKIAAEFGLSEDRGIQIAKLASQWGALKKKRTLTSADAHAFSKQVIGVDLETATKAFKKSLEGDKTDLNALFDKAAEVNNTTPERINKIFNELLNK